MCERSPLGLPHTQNRMSCRPRVVEILLMNSPKTLRVCGDLKTRPKFVGSDSWGQFFCQLSEIEREDQEEGGQAEGGRSCGTHEAHALPGCVRAHPRTHAPEYLQGRCARWPGCRASGGIGDARCRNKRERHGGGAPMMSKSCLSCQTF